MLAQINPVALPALRIAATFFLIVNISASYISFAIGTGSSTKIQTYPEDIEPVRKLRIEVVLIPWCTLTLVVLILLIYLWSQ